MPIKWRTGKQNVNIIWQQKEWNADACYDMDRFWKHAKGKNQDTKYNVGLHSFEMSE